MLRKRPGYLVQGLCSLLLVANLPVAGAAPHPATASSQLISPKIGLYISDKGYRISASQTQWVQTEPPPAQQFVEAMYRPIQERESNEATLTVRTDPLDDTTKDRDAYMAKWLKDYPRYGFQVLASRPVEMQKLNGYLIDLIHTSANKQLRQLIFIKDKQAAILTCRDDRSTFLTSLQTCNQIFRNFAWLQ